MRALASVVLVLSIIVFSTIIAVLMNKRESFTTIPPVTYIQSTGAGTFPIPIGKTTGSSIPASLRTERRFSIQIQPNYEVAVLNMNGPRSRYFRNNTSSPITENVVFQMGDTDAFVVNPITPVIGVPFKLSTDGVIVKTASTGGTVYNSKVALRNGTEMIFRLDSYTGQCWGSGGNPVTQTVTHLIDVNRNITISKGFGPVPHTVLINATFIGSRPDPCCTWKFEPQPGGGVFIRRMYNGYPSETVSYIGLNDHFILSTSSVPTKFYIEPVSETDTTLATLRERLSSYHR